MALNFRLMYPNVLGSITEHRLLTEELQFAVGLFPKSAFINQPVEVVIVLQSMIDQNMQLKVGLQLPTKDKKGHPIAIDTPKETMSLGLGPGEVGVLRLPVVAQPPTPPGQYPIRVAIRYRAPEGNRIRPPDGGPPPSVLEISPFRLQVLRDVDFESRMWNDSIDIITVVLDVASRTMPQIPSGLKPRYETLWTAHYMERERELVTAHLEEARLLATRLVHGSSYPDLYKAVVERFEARGLPLHPGEAIAIAKMMTYTVDEAPTLETSIKLEGTRWFRAMAQVLAHDEQMFEMKRGELLAHYCFDAILFDSIGIAFNLVQPKVKENLGDLNERIAYANRLLMWIAGQGHPDLNYVYLPLVLGGITVNRIVTHTREAYPWRLVEELWEAYRGRMRLEISDATVVVFHMVEQLLTEAERMLVAQRLPRHQD